MKAASPWSSLCDRQTAPESHLFPSLVYKVCNLGAELCCSLSLLSLPSFMSLPAPSRTKIATQMLSPVLTLALEAAGFLGDATKRTKQEELQPGEPPKIRLTLALRGMGG